MQDKPTLCWKCAHACGGCSWSADFIPVNGWNAIPTVINPPESNIDSFIVEKFPKFSDDTERYAKKVKSAKVEFKYVKKPFAPRIPAKSRRGILMRKPDLRERIDRLTGEQKIIAELIFLYNNTLEDAAEAMYMSYDTAKRMIQKAMEGMEALA